MTQPVTPTTTPSVTAPQQVNTPVNPDVIETAVKVRKVQTFAKNFASKVGLPTLIGSTSALVTTAMLSRRNRDNDSDVVFDSSSDNDNE